MARSKKRAGSQDSLPWYRLLESFLFSKRGVMVAIVVTLLCYVLISLWSSLVSPSGSGDALKDTREIGQAGNDIQDNHRDSQREESCKNSTTSPVVVEKEFDKRRELYEKECGTKKEGRVATLFLHPPSKLAVCHVQKVGCTFWKRLFRYLYQDFGDRTNEVKSLFDVDRVLVHFGGSTKYREYNYKSSEGRILADASTKVLFSRDPYSRLWSGYVDKFLLPDSWLDHGRAISYAKKRAAGQKTNCPDHIEFEDFLLYTFRNHDDHWKPIAEICDPCTFHPKYVGHMETFGRDVKHILDTRGLGYLLEDHDHIQHSRDEVRLIIDYHFQLYNTRLPLHKCLTSVQLASRLWHAFQINGYFKMDSVFVEEKIRKAIDGLTILKARDAVIEIFLEELHRSPNTKQQWQQQREENIVNAYREISSDLKKKIAKRFQADFRLFGFDSRPPDERST